MWRDRLQQKRNDQGHYQQTRDSKAKSREINRININDEIKLSSLTRQQDRHQISINRGRGRQEKGINQSIKTILYQKHEVCPRLVSVSRLNYFSVPAQFSSLSSVLLFVILIQESSAAKPCCNFSFIPIVRHCAILLLLQRGKRPTPSFDSGSF